MGREAEMGFLIHKLKAAQCAVLWVWLDHKDMNTPVIIVAKVCRDFSENTLPKADRR